jgi:hypothetical protein
MRGDYALPTLMALVFAGCDGNLSTAPLVAPTALAYTFAQTGATFTGTFDQVGTCTAAAGRRSPTPFPVPSRARSMGPT